MALLVEDLGLIFFLSPGTGSTSLSSFFVSEFGGRWIVDPEAGKHATPHEVRAAGIRLENYLCISTTRNPFDFYISQYHKKRTWTDDGEDFIFARTHTFSAFLERTLAVTPDGLLHPSYLGAADVVFRKEKLEQDTKEMLARLNSDVSFKLPLQNVSEDLNHDLLLWYTKEELQIIEAKHKEHFETFGYSRSEIDPAIPLKIDASAIKKMRRFGSFMVSEGRDGWLYLSDASNRVMAHALGNYSPLDRWADEWRNVIDERCRSVASYGGRYAQFIVPNTHTAVSRFMPGGDMVTDERPTDLLVNHLQGLPFFDLTPLFRKAEPEECFVPTDSHWSTYGAYLGYKAVCDALHVESANVPREAFHWEPVVGDLGIKLSPNRVSRSLTVDPQAFAKLCGGHSTIFDNHVEVLGKARIFHAVRPRVKGSLFIIGDSYTYANLAFFASTFAETYFFHTRTFDRMLIRDLSPDFVIAVNCERFVLDAPRNSDTREYLAEYGSKLLSDTRNENRCPKPTFSWELGFKQISRLLPLYASFEEVYDRLLGINGVTICRIQALYKLLLQREGRPEDHYDKWLRHTSLDGLLTEFLLSSELHNRFGIGLTANSGAEPKRPNDTGQPRAD